MFNEAQDSTELSTFTQNSTQNTKHADNRNNTILQYARKKGTYNALLSSSMQDEREGHGSDSHSSSAEKLSQCSLFVGYLLHRIQRRQARVIEFACCVRQI